MDVVLHLFCFHSFVAEISISGPVIWNFSEFIHCCVCVYVCVCVFVFVFVFVFTVLKNMCTSHFTLLLSSSFLLQ